MCVRPRNSSGRVDCFDLSRCLRSGQYKYTTSSYEPLVNIMRKFRGLLSWGVAKNYMCVSFTIIIYVFLKDFDGCRKKRAAGLGREGP